MKIRHTLFIGILFILGLSAPTLLVQGNALTCANDYYSFILTVRNEDTRNQFIEDFKRGYCQLNDLTILEDELDSVRENFRSAAFNCLDTTAYKEEYRRILMEQYFIRNVQKNRSDVIRTDEAAAFDAAKEKILSALQGEMKGIFVSGKDAYFTEGVFDDYFNSWVLKYEDRIGNYNQCSEGGFAQIQKSWDDFVETIRSLGEDFNIDTSQKTSFTDNFSADNNLDETKDEVQDTARSVINSWNYYKNILDLGKIEVEAPAQVSDFDGSQATYTFDTLLETLEKDTNRAVIQSESVERMAKYKLLYGEGGAVAATDMQGILEYMNQVISETNTKDFPNILSGVSKIYDRQCN